MFDTHDDSNAAVEPSDDGASSGAHDSVQAGLANSNPAPLSLDPQAGLVYVPVANPAPDFLADARPGANLYTNSLVVLDARLRKQEPAPVR